LSSQTCRKIIDIILYTAEEVSFEETDVQKEDWYEHVVIVYGAKLSKIL
jgi:hypothetical protein